ncbi:cytochrome P450 [Massariosphaeria phaeospora]|uniref:Cytochrome P450 n=1 Tax=Massariosphaeria phaeospora TaxID=100035 RepID=A0A7C8M6T5_9PLEO|nr:cytochrome P450 [Massariosphaeria phaeospora]
MPLSEFILQVLLALPVYWILGKVIHHTAKLARKRKRGCRDPPTFRHSDTIWGLDLFFKTMNAFQGGRYLETHSALFSDFTSKTFESHSFGTTVYQTYDPEVSKAFQSIYCHDFGIEPLRYHVAENLWGNGIVVSDGRKWADARNFIRSSFDIVHTANLERLSHHVDKFMNLLPRDGSTIDLQPSFKRLILDTSSEFIFGESLNSLEHPDHRFMHAFEYAQRGTGIRAVLGRLKFLHRDKRWFEACKQVTEFCDERVKEAVARLEKEKERRTETDRLRLVDEAAKVTGDQYTLRSLILSVFSPAHDGAAIALSNAFFHLSRHPRAWQKLREEIMESKQQSITYELLNSMHYLKNILRETHRVTPIVSLNQRICLRDVVLPRGGGTDGNHPLYICKGDIVEVDYRKMMRSPEIWGDKAGDFVPERWEKTRPTWEYTPFGGGPRACPGQRLVFTECAYTVVRMLRVFEQLENRDQELEWKEEMRMTFQSRNGALVGLIPSRDQGPRQLFAAAPF